VTPRLVLRPQAAAELLDARDWYEEQRPGLGGAFATEVDRVLARIVGAPLAYARVQGETRRALVRRFPYAIYFHAMSDEIVVLWRHRQSTTPSTLAVAALTSNFPVEQTAARIRSLAAAHRGVVQTG
jgi:plasmid stabilization system protein ParE